MSNYTHPRKESRKPLKPQNAATTTAKAIATATCVLCQAQGRTRVVVKDGVGVHSGPVPLSCGTLRSLPPTARAIFEALHSCKHSALFVFIIISFFAFFFLFIKLLPRLLAFSQPMETVRTALIGFC